MGWCAVGNWVTALGQAPVRGNDLNAVGQTIISVRIRQAKPPLEGNQYARLKRRLPFEGKVSAQ
jgi:hypothetical protein